MATPQVAASKKFNIIERASKLIGQLTTSVALVKDNATLGYKAADKQEARAIAITLIYASIADQLTTTDRVKPLDHLLSDYKFSYDESSHKASLTFNADVMHAKKTDRWAVPANTMLLSLAKFKTMYPLQNEHRFFKESHGKKLEIYPHNPDKANLAAHTQVQLLQTLGDYHGRKVEWEIVDLPTHLLPAPGGKLDMRAVHAYRQSQRRDPHKAIKSFELAQQEAALRQQAEATQRQKDAAKSAKQTIDAAREAQPASITHLEESFKNLMKPNVKNKEEASLIMRAAESLANALDVRDLKTLARADYDLTVLEKQAENTKLHRQLSEMLLSDDNLYTTATYAKLGTAYDPERASHEMTPRMKLDHDRQVEKNRKFLRENPKAVTLIEQESFRIPGLVFLLQAATLPLTEGKLQADQAWKRRRNQTAERIIEKAPDNWQGTVATLLDDCCRGASKAI